MRIPVVFAADDAFALPLAVSVASVVRSADLDDELEVHILAHGIDAASRSLVERAAAREPVITLHWHAIDDAQFAELPTGHLASAAYFRLLIPDLLDEPRAIYLDSDVVVRRSLRPLMERDLRGCAVAAARNLTVPFLASRQGVAGWRELDLPPSAAYFNSGVLVMDLERWRSDRITERALDYAERFEDGVSFADQDALNAVLVERWDELEPAWNQMPLIFDDWSGVFALLPEDDVEEAREDPAVVHFAGSDKPWLVGCARPWADAWVEIARRLDPGWTPQPRRTRREELRWRVRRAAHVLARGR